MLKAQSLDKVNVSVYLEMDWLGWPRSVPFAKLLPFLDVDIS